MNMQLTNLQQLCDAKQIISKVSNMDWNSEGVSNTCETCAKTIETVLRAKGDPTQYMLGGIIKLPVCICLKTGNMESSTKNRKI